MHIVLFIRPHKGIRLSSQEKKKIVSARSYVNFIPDHFILKSRLREIKLEEQRSVEKRKVRTIEEVKKKKTENFVLWILKFKLGIVRL